MSHFPDGWASGEAAGVAPRHRIPIKPKSRPNLALAVWSSVWMAPCLLQRQHWASSSTSHRTWVYGDGLQISLGRHTPLCPLLTGLLPGCSYSSGNWHKDKGVSAREPELLRGNCWPSQVQVAVTCSLRLPPIPNPFCTHMHWLFHCTLYCVY